MVAIMRLMAIDPGDSTGIAVITKHENYMLTAMSTYQEDKIDMELYLFPPTIIYIESAPAHGSRKQAIIVDRVRTLAKKQCPNALVFSITPAQWKPFSEARGWNHPQAVTQHEKDAYNIARYILWHKQGIDVGILEKPEIKLK